MDAFILSGKLKNTIIPSTILTRLIEFYRQTDIELLEKAILNLNLSRYPNVVSVRHICEEEFLSSALIHLKTTQYDEERGGDDGGGGSAICISILSSLYNLMNKCQVEKSLQDVLNLPRYMEN